MSRSSSDSRVFAIVPAAGTSRRMGKPKLLLPWRGHTVIDSVLDAWTSSDVSSVIVVCRKEDSALISVCQNWSVDVVSPSEDPPDMKSSLQHAVSLLQDKHVPTDMDHWMVAPADLPTLDTAVINRVIHARDTASVVVPRFDGRASHPVLLPWSVSGGLWELNEDEGLNTLVERHPKRFVDFEESAYAQDIDTPEDYERMSRNVRR